MLLLGKVQEEASSGLNGIQPVCSQHAHQSVWMDRNEVRFITGLSKGYKRETAVSLEWPHCLQQYIFLGIAEAKYTRIVTE